MKQREANPVLTYEELETVHRKLLDDFKKLGWELDRLRKLLADHDWKCRYRNSGVGGNDPQECSWPECGCDPAANRVFQHLDECGFEITKQQPVVIKNCIELTIPKEKP